MTSKIRCWHKSSNLPVSRPQRTRFAADDRHEDIGDNARNRALVKKARDLIKSLGKLR